MNFMRNDATCSESHKKSDIYCYGMSMLEMLERRKPWHNLSADEIQEMVLCGKRPVPSDVLKDKIASDPIHNLLYDIVQKCWKVYAVDRASSDEIVGILEEALDKFIDTL
jgi:serine/threonine protein kinase